MKRKMFSMLAVAFALICFTVLTVSASEELAYGDFTYEVQQDSTVKITGYSGGNKDVIIPSEIDGKTVTTLGTGAFDSCGRVSSVTVPKEIISIENYAFYGSPIEKIIVSPENEHYSSDKYGVLFNKDKTELIKYSSGSDRSEYAIPDTVTKLRTYSFLYCSKLKNITIPASLEVISDRAFEGCAFETLIIPGTVKIIEECAFAECGRLKNLYIEKGLEKVEHDAFLYCENVNVYFSGSKREWKAIDIAYSNSILTATPAHFNATYPCDHVAEYTRTQQGQEVCGGTVTHIYTCNICGGSYSEDSKLPGHIYDYNEVKTKATLKKNGSVKRVCITCNDTVTVKTISRPASITLSSTQAAYNGKVKTAKVTVKAADKTVIGKENYTVKYESGRKLPGKYTITVTFKGNYEGTKKLYFTITPKAPAKVTAKTTVTTATLSWAKVTGATRYEVYKYNSSAKKYEFVKSTTKTSLKISSLKSGTVYKFKVRARTDDDGKIYGPYSAVVQAVTKLAAPSKVSATGTASTIKLTWSKVSGATGYRIYYKSGDSWKIAVKSVSSASYTFKKLKAGTKRTYAVSAYKKTSAGTLWSERKTLLASTKPAKAVLTVKSPSAGKATLTWKAVSGANTYNVYYRINNKGEFKFYKTYSSPKTVSLSGLKGGVTYTFRVKAGVKVTGGTVWSDNSDKSVKITYRTPKYLKAMKSGNYLITTVYGSVESTVAIKSDYLYIKFNDYYNDDADYTMIYNPNQKKWYYFYDSSKVYTVIDDSILSEDSRGEELIKSIKNQSVPSSYKSGTGTIDGKKVFTEAITQDGVTTTYYYEGTKLVGIGTSYQGVSVYEKVKEFTTDVPGSLFSIPSGYQYVQ